MVANTFKPIPLFYRGKRFVSFESAQRARQKFEPTYKSGRIAEKLKNNKK